ncbi:MAG: HlyD family efflux transporter periplasmic adaptor subunit [Lachnospiraceae bacterium]|nr:HlyD family efflux transporter periplasmic adaptor subunit [Lachnospiraceae bacterium]
MNEKTSKRKDWIKNAAIVFLVVMLILTFFSNTIMNYSLPQVATDYVNSGTITTKIRGTGTVTSVDPYSVILGDEDAPATTRKIQKLMVQVGDTVEKGDVLLMLDEKTNTALEDLEKAVDAAQAAYDAAKQAPGVTNDIIAKGTGSFDSAAYNQQIVAAQEDLNAQNKVVADLEKTIAAFNAQLGLTGSDSDSKVYSAQNALINAEKTQLVSEQKLKEENAKLAAFDAELPEYSAYVTAQNNFIQAEQKKIEKNKAYEDADAAWNAETDSDKKDELEEKKTEAEIEANTANAEYNVAQNNLSTAEAAYNAAKASQTDRPACEQAIAKLTAEKAKAEADIEKYTYELELAKKEQSSTVNNLNAQKSNYELQLKVAQSAQTEKQNLLNELTGNLKLITDIRAAKLALREAKNALEKGEEENISAEVTAGVAGTISSIAYKSGQTVSTGETLMVIQPAGQGYTISIPVTTEQSRRVHIGDSAELVNNWWYNDVSAVLKSIRPDTSDPANKKLLVFSLEGDVSDGQNLTLSIGDRSSNYDMIVPNSAIREDNNGKFVLKVEVKSSPLGNRYKATRVDVEVIAEDDTHSAIKGAMYSWDYVVTTSNKPIEAGQLIRLSEN